jgi:hypothetical protein
MERVGTCDECLAREIVCDAILNYRAVKLCKRCLSTCDAIETGKSHFDEVPQVAGPSTKDVLFRMSGLDQHEWSGKEGERQSLQDVNMDYLRMKKRQRDLAARAEKEAAEREAAAAALATEAAEVAMKPERKSPAYWEILQKRKLQQTQNMQQAQQPQQAQGPKIELIYSEKEMPDPKPEEPKRSWMSMFKRKKTDETADSVGVEAVNAELANEKL